MDKRRDKMRELARVEEHEITAHRVNSNTVLLNLSWSARGRIIRND
jgi:hypothetical protein